MRSAVIGLAVGLWAATANAHLAVFTPGMWCANGTDGNNPNSDDPVTPLYELEQAQWWFHADNGCANAPPKDGDILELPAGQTITLEIATNQGYTTMSFDGEFSSDWPDGGTYPSDYNVPSCITSPNMHTQNQSMAAGTALAIAYVSDIADVTPENLVVFSVTYNTPWLRLTDYEIPADMPACPEGGCICGWGWIPNACGQSNIYHEAIRCNVTGATSTTPVGTPQAPVWCEDDPSACVTGPKQMLYWHQASGNNIEVDGNDLAGELKSPAYNAKCGFSHGAQNDIFTGSGTDSSSSSSSSSSSTTSETTSSDVSSSTASETSSSDASSSTATETSSSDASSSTETSSSDASSSTASESSSDASSSTATETSSSDASSSTATETSSSDASSSTATETSSSDASSSTATETSPSDASSSSPTSSDSSSDSGSSTETSSSDTSSSTDTGSSTDTWTSTADATTSSGYEEVAYTATTTSATVSSTASRKCKPRPSADRRALRRDTHKAASAHRRKAHHRRLDFD